MPSNSFIISTIGGVLLLHSAYSCMHYRSLLQDMDLIGEQDDTQNEYPIPPMDVYIEVAVAFGLILLGELISVGKMQPVDIFASKDRKPLMAPPYRTRDFDV
ncbi:MAG: hypothetical protein SGARI_006782, partial [Bacillariaceae sp.]